jgi:hypothetical protein
MIIGQAVPMIRQHLDNAAFGDPSAAALGNHAPQLALKGAQPRDPLLDLAKMHLRDAVDDGAGAVGMVGEAQQLANGIE